MGLDAFVLEHFQQSGRVAKMRPTTTWSLFRFHRNGKGARLKRNSSIGGKDAAGF